MSRRQGSPGSVPGTFFTAKDSKRRKHDWKFSVHGRDGYRCVACGSKGTATQLQAHHLIFKSHVADQFKWVRGNGVTLCGDFMKNRCHGRLHQGQLKIRKEWLPGECLALLSVLGLYWDEEGVPWGPCRKYFAPLD